jgi:hypothetical protein
MCSRLSGRKTMMRSMHAPVRGELDRQPAQPLLELSDVGLAGLQVRAAGLEERPAAGLCPHRQQRDEARFPASRLADDEQRARRPLQDAGFAPRQQIADGVVLDEQRTLDVVFDESPERLEVLAIQRRTAERRQRLEQLA